MSLYSLLKLIHVSCAVLSISGFILRGLWMLNDSPYRQHVLSRRLPHVVDSLLLATALIMVFMSAQYPFVLDWLTAKVVALVVYILLGMVALRWGRTRNQRLLAWLAALASFGYILAVAMSRSPWPFAGWI